MSLKQFEVKAARIDHSMMGIPRNGRRFLRGILLLPPLAGMMHRVVMLRLSKGVNVVDDELQI